MQIKERIYPRPVLILSLIKNDDIYKVLREARELAQSEFVVEYNGKQTKSVKKTFSRLYKG